MNDTTKHRNPLTIAAEAQALHDAARKAFVPANVVRASELACEFMAATAAALREAGLIAEPSDADQAAA